MSTALVLIDFTIYDRGVHASPKYQAVANFSDDDFAFSAIVPFTVETKCTMHFDTIESYDDIRVTLQRLLLLMNEASQSFRSDYIIV